MLDKEYEKKKQNIAEMINRDNILWKAHRIANNTNSHESMLQTYTQTKPNKTYTGFSSSYTIRV